MIIQHAGARYSEQQPADVGPCRGDIYCREAEAPYCAECEHHHCGGCGHPMSYTVLRFVERDCGCVYVEARSVHTRLWRGVHETTETTELRHDPASRCADHAERCRLERIESDRREAERAAERIRQSHSDGW